MEQALSAAPTIRLKASLYPFTVLALERVDLKSIEQELHQKLRQAPQLLRYAPVVIQLPAQPITVERTKALIKLIKHLNLIPVGLRYPHESGVLLAEAVGLALLKDSSIKEKAPVNKPPMILKSPVRSGQQFVNSEGDLIVFGNVGQGAEVLASGSIQVYGTLHGRALAGINGDEQATITCHKLQSELLAIAGHYQVSEDMAAQHWQQTAHICLRDGRLIIDSD